MANITVINFMIWSLIIKQKVCHKETIGVYVLKFTEYITKYHEYKEIFRILRKYYLPYI